VRRVVVDDGEPPGTDVASWGRLQSMAPSAAVLRLRWCNWAALVANVEQREVEANEGEEGSELVWKNRAGRFPFYSGGGRQGAAAKSTTATWLQRRRGVGDIGIPNGPAKDVTRGLPKAHESKNMKFGSPS
jgi:hypothetical protein